MLDVRRIKWDLLRIHAEDAGFVATQRSMAVEAPNYRLIDIYDLEQRLNGHLDALVLAGDAGCEVVNALADESRNSENTGTLLHVALRQQRRDLVEFALTVASEAEDQSRFREHLGRASSWCSADVLSGVMRNWISAREPLLRWIAFDVCGFHRVDPRDHLQNGLADADDLVRERAIALAGELGRVDCLDQIHSLGGYEADVSAVLLGDLQRARNLTSVSSFIERPRSARKSAELFPLALAHGEAKDAIRAMLAHTPTRRWAIVAIGALGSATVLSWLIDAMESPSDARVAVSAFEQITGLYFAHDDLELEEFPDAPTNELVDEDLTESLIEANTPWPDISRVRLWLEANGSRFQGDARLLFGLPAWTFTGPPEAWVRYQSRFRAIALTQALQRPANRCPNWRGPVTLLGRTFSRQWQL